jgi:hypothetical protein
MLNFQIVPEAKVGKNRVHWDVLVDDLEVGTKLRLGSWQRCDDCGANVPGRGKWLSIEDLRQRGVDPKMVPVIEDSTTKRPPCRVCGTRGTELHHWAPPRGVRRE